MYSMIAIVYLFHCIAHEYIMLEIWFQILPLLNSHAIAENFVVVIEIINIINFFIRALAIHINSAPCVITFQTDLLH